MPRTKEFKEQEVLQKAVDLFWCKGYHATSMEDLTAGVGLSRSSLYDTFGCKKELLMSALHFYTAQAHEELRKITHLPLLGIAKIEALVKGVIDSFAPNQPQKGCFVVNVATELASQDAEVQQFVKENLERVKNIFLPIVLEGIADGSFTPTLPAEDLAYYLFNTYNGLQVSGKMGASQDVLQRMWQASKLAFIT